MMWQYFNQTEPVFTAAWDRELRTLSRSTFPSVSTRLILIFIHPRPLLRLSDSTQQVFDALYRHQDFGMRAGFHRESICWWHWSYIRLCQHHKIWSRKSFVCGPTDRPAAQQYSQRKTQGGEHCCLLVNLCSKEIVRGISYVCSENLDLLRIYICVWKFLLYHRSNQIKAAFLSNWSAFDRLPESSYSWAATRFKIICEKNAYSELPLEKTCFTLFVPYSFDFLFFCSTFHWCSSCFVILLRIIGELLKSDQYDENVSFDQCKIYSLQYNN